MSQFLTSPVQSENMPKGIPYIIGNEAAERFSFYGMRTILVIYMTKYLVDAAGDAAPMPEAEAKTYFHLFVASAYFFPIFGALLADGFLGKYKTILSLSIIYCLGHLMLAIGDSPFSIGGSRPYLFSGLFLIAVGTGAIKPCVTAHVGDQFGKQNQHLMSKVFGWFYFSINLGASASSLATPYLLDKFGPGVAFGIPGILMFIATVVFWMGRNVFVHIPAGGADFVRECFSGIGLKALLNLVPVYIFVAMFWALFDQTGSAWVLQAQNMDLEFAGVYWLPSQIQAVNLVMILIFIPLFSYVIYPAIDKVFPLTPLRKIAIGLFVTVFSFATSAYIDHQITGGQIVSSTSTSTTSGSRSVRILDEKTSNAGWVSGDLTKMKVDEESELKPGFPQEIVIRLRERTAWEINQIGLNPATQLAEFFKAKGKEPAEDEIKACWAKEVEVLVAPDLKTVGDKDSFQSVGMLTFEQQDETQTIQFDATTAEYVKLRILSNHGGDIVSFGEVSVDSVDGQNVAASGELPSIAWQILAYAILTAAEVMVSITTLEFSYTQAPKKMKSFIMSLYLLSVTLGNLFTAAVNWIIQDPDGNSRLDGPSYYWFFTGTMLVSAVGFVVIAKKYKGQTFVQGDDEDEDSAGDNTEPAAD